MKRMIAWVFALGMVMVPLRAFGIGSGSDSGKNLCLLYSQNCPNQSLTYQEKIARLKAEIDKGQQVYSAAELQRLEGKLKDNEDLFYNLEYGPSGHAFGHGHR